MLRANGFKNVFSLEGGMSAWPYGTECLNKNSPINFAGRNGKNGKLIKEAVR